VIRVSRRARWQGFALAGILPSALHLVLTLGYDSSYSHQLYLRRLFLDQYEHHIYRFRVVGRELVLAVDRVLQHFNVVLHTTATDIGHGRPPADLFTAFVVVNGVAFVALATVLYLATAAGAEWRSSYIVVIVLVALSGYVVTPYDNLGYLFTVAAVVVALQGRWWAPPLCLVLACIGTATRESFVVALAAVAAVLLGRYGWRALVRLRDPVWWSAVALGAGWLGTYATLRIVLADSAESGSMWQTIPREFNWQMSSVVGIVFYVLGAWVLQMTWPALPAGEERRRWRVMRLLLWILSIPYVAACFFGGIWFEAMRLLMPILLCEHVLRRAVAGWSQVAGVQT
jgi:hypothetical protein